MDLLPLLASIIFLQSPAVADKAAPPADRSGEPVLKQMLESAGKLKNLAMSVSTNSRARAAEIYQVDESVQIWYEKSDRYCVQVSSMWGDGGRFVSDGKTFMSDPMDDSQPITLRDSRPSMYETDPEVARRIDPLVYLLSGPKGIERMVAKDGFIKAIDPAGPEKAVQYKSVNKGVVTVFYMENDPRMLVHRVEFDNKPWLEEQFKLYPEWYDSPEEPMTVVSISYLSIGKALPKRVFDVRPPAGKYVVDNRKGSTKKPPQVLSGLAGL